MQVDSEEAQDDDDDDDDWSGRHDISDERSHRLSRQLSTVNVGFLLSSPALSTTNDHCLVH